MSSSQARGRSRPRLDRVRSEEEGHDRRIVHVLACNDFHGNLEPATLNIYGQFAGGAAWLAKAVKDKQAAVRRPRRSTVFAGDNIGASPLVDGLFFGEPSTIVDQPDARRLRVGRQPRVRQGHRPSCCASRTAAAAPMSAAPARRTPGRRRHHEALPRRRLPVPVGQRRASTPPARPCSRRTGSRRSGATAATKFEVGFIGEVLKETPTIVTPTGVAGLTFQDEADAANKCGQASCEARASTRASS